MPACARPNARQASRSSLGRLLRAVLDALEVPLAVRVADAAAHDLHSARTGRGGASERRPQTRQAGVVGARMGAAGHRADVVAEHATVGRASVSRTAVRTAAVGRTAQIGRASTRELESAKLLEPGRVKSLAAREACGARERIARGSVAGIAPFLGRSVLVGRCRIAAIGGRPGFLRRLRVGGTDVARGGVVRRGRSSSLLRTRRATTGGRRGRGPRRRVSNRAIGVIKTARALGRQGDARARTHPHSGGWPAREPAPRA